MTSRSPEAEFLARAGRLMLEHNDSTGEIRRALSATANALTDRPCRFSIHYGGVSVAIDGELPAIETIRELRYNAALQVEVRAVLDQAQRGELDPVAGFLALERIERESKRHPALVVVSILGIAAAALARILGADVGATAVAGVSTGLGLVARHALGRHGVSLLTLPLVAAFLGAALGGVATRLGWTGTPELALIVPSLMLVPGPHLINGLFDLIDNQIPMSVARLGLATGILLASALGIVVGMELLLPDLVSSARAARTGHLTVLTDMLLAGVVTCGFAAFYNTAWRHTVLAAAGGMAGHGLRFLALEAGCRLELATFLGGLAVGAISGWLARAKRLPVAVVAFAGAVTMMPGLHMYRALGGALQLARRGAEADPATVGAALGDASAATLVVLGLSLGLVVGARSVMAIGRDPDHFG